jgi:lysozyme
MSAFKGADVSHWQGQIDWDLLNTGASFVIIKATGGDDGLYTDSQFTRNCDEARRVGLPRGFYHFAGGGDARQEAEYLVGSIGDLQQGEVLALDWEITHNDPVAWCAAFVDRVEELVGFVPMFYTNQNRVVTIDWQPLVDRDCALWVAHYDISPDNDVPIKYWPYYAIHQYSSTASFPGISGNVDADMFFAPNLDTFYKFGAQGDE